MSRYLHALFCNTLKSMNYVYCVCTVFSNSGKFLQHTSEESLDHQSQHHIWQILQFCVQALFHIRMDNKGILQLHNLIFHQLTLDIAHLVFLEKDSKTEWEIYHHLYFSHPRVYEPGIDMEHFPSGLSYPKRKNITWTSISITEFTEDPQRCKLYQNLKIWSDQNLKFSLRLKGLGMN